jgi:hypothetical protein
LIIYTKVKVKCIKLTLERQREKEFERDLRERERRERERERTHKKREKGDDKKIISFLIDWGPRSRKKRKKIWGAMLCQQVARKRK